MASTAQDLADLLPDATQLQRNKHSPTLNPLAPRVRGAISPPRFGWKAQAIACAMPSTLNMLFGSWVRGTITRRPDVDFGSMPDELSRGGDRPFIRQLLAEGLPLYERGKVTAES
ncbi:MAG: hypothetical protein O2890_10190 [Cyanobacteria bacterium]|nr:hypothetical protein [Cyanobacteriota bacterium]MDA0866770.1 hypothetical protein [Cyanobacteriota bacterium]